MVLTRQVIVPPTPPQIYYPGGATAVTDGSALASSGSVLADGIGCVRRGRRSSSLQQSLSVVPPATKTLPHNPKVDKAGYPPGVNCGVALAWKLSVNIEQPGIWSQSCCCSVSSLRSVAIHTGGKTPLELVDHTSLALEGPHIIVIKLFIRWNTKVTSPFENFGLEKVPMCLGILGYLLLLHLHRQMGLEGELRFLVVMR